MPNQLGDEFIADHQTCSPAGAEADFATPHVMEGNRSGKIHYKHFAVLSCVFLVLVLGFTSDKKVAETNPMVPTPAKSEADHHLQIAAMLSKKSDQAKEMYHQALVDADQMKLEGADMFALIKERMSAGAPKEVLRGMAEEVRSMEIKEKESRRRACMMLYQSKKFDWQARQEVIKGNQQKLKATSADDEREYAIYMIEQAEAALAGMEPMDAAAEDACPPS
ncbi:MAG: hypothetical protein KDD66_03390 [Bdellovibrionales bacterium]|nr:hypothetical protein [Bdellovibrionales bacterium]